jgi:hypothetical protein
MTRRARERNKRESEEGIGVKVLRDKDSRLESASEKGKSFDCGGEREKRCRDRKGRSASALAGRQLEKGKGR